MTYDMERVKVFKASALVFTAIVMASVPVVWEAEEKANTEGAKLHPPQ